MDIKERLKELDVKIGNFADELKITRPTLNSYIKLFEEGNKLPNPKYQIIFNRLFGDEELEREEFDQTVSRYHYLLERDGLLGAKDLDPKKTNLMFSVLEQVRSDLNSDDYNENIYIFINMLITSYRAESVFTEFVNYFLYLNSIIPLDKITPDEEIFISNCYRLMHLAKDSHLKLDKVFWGKFKERVLEIETRNAEISKEKMAEALKLKLNDLLDEKIQEQLKLGLDVKEIDYDKLIKSIDLSKLTD